MLLVVVLIFGAMAVNFALDAFATGPLRRHDLARFSAGRPLPNDNVEVAAVPGFEHMLAYDMQTRSEAALGFVVLPLTGPDWKPG